MYVFVINFALKIDGFCHVHSTIRMNYFCVSNYERCKQAAEIFLYYSTKGQIRLTEHACRQRKK